MLIRHKNLAEQTADWLREGLHEGRWGKDVPGVPSLAKQCGISKLTAQRALELLEKEGLITHGGNGHRRQIAVAAIKKATRLRVAILLRDNLENEDSGFRTIMANVGMELEARGHIHIKPAKTLADLKYDDDQAIKMAANTSADMWIVAGASRELLQWFLARPQPVLALGGAIPENPIALVGSISVDASIETIRLLHSLGHRRIVFLLPRYLLHPVFTTLATRIQNELEAHDIPTGPYNFPEWEDTPAGLHARLESMFRITPPTAIIASYPAWAVAVMTFLARKGLRVPDDVSVVCRNHDSIFSWIQPSLAHFQIDDSKFVHRVMRWVDNVARGIDDKRRVAIPSKLIQAQSIGPAKKMAAAVITAPPRPTGPR